ncbi:MAG: ABC transporter ATP-binding protein [Opitutales bacterium]|nr:ABC transporter ATP-binding protein [Opitutales bacterium]
MSAFIELRGITKRYGDAVAVDGVDLDLVKGEVFSLLGPSGCGKTTLLRILAGFIMPDAGTVRVDGVDLTRVPANQRPINTVFQNYALFPHLSVRQNIAFGRKIAGVPAAQIRREVDRMLDLIQMAGHADKRPHQISGGQKQRVAIARALINEPRLLLLDEPLAALDLKLRQHMLLELERIHRDVGTTFLYVTHDQGEAMGLSDRLAVMNGGRVEQIGAPAEVYEAPATRFVADFIGDTNILDGHAGSRPRPDYLSVELGSLGRVLAWCDRPVAAGKTLHLCLRPEKIRLERPNGGVDDDWNRVGGTITEYNYFGSHTRFVVRAGALDLSVVQPHRRCFLDEKPFAPGDPVMLSWHPDDGYVIPGNHGVPAEAVLQ